MSEFPERMSNDDAYKEEQDDIISALLEITIVLQSTVYPLMRQSEENRKALEEADKSIRQLIDRMRKIADRRKAHGHAK